MGYIVYLAVAMFTGELFELTGVLLDDYFPNSKAALVLFINSKRQKDRDHLPDVESQTDPHSGTSYTSAVSENMFAMNADDHITLRESRVYATERREAANL